MFIFNNEIDLDRFEGLTITFNADSLEEANEVISNIQHNNEDSLLKAINPNILELKVVQTDVRLDPTPNTSLNLDKKEKWLATVYLEKVMVEVDHETQW